MGLLHTDPLRQGERVLFILFWFPLCFTCHATRFYSHFILHLWIVRLTQATVFRFRFFFFFLVSACVCVSNFLDWRSNWTSWLRYSCYIFSLLQLNQFLLDASWRYVLSIYINNIDCDLVGGIERTIPERNETKRNNARSEATNE